MNRHLVTGLLFGLLLIEGCAGDEEAPTPTNTEPRLVSTNFSIQTLKPEDVIECKDKNQRMIRVDLSLNADNSVKKIYIVCEGLKCE